MEKYAWKARVVSGKLPEYKRRHDELWEEMKDLLTKAGIKNYTIWSDGELLFGYYECEKGVDYALSAQKGAAVVDKWNEYMKDILIMEMAPDGGQPRLEKVFSFN